MKAVDYILNNTLPGPEGCEGTALKNLEFPDSALLLMITRRKKIKGEYSRKKTEKYIWQVLPPRGGTILRGLDSVTVLSKIEDEKMVVYKLLNSFNDTAE